MGILSTKLTTATPVTAGGLVPVGTITHKSGFKLSASGNTWTISGSGYSVVFANITLAPTTAGAVTVTMYDNGQAIASAQGTTASAGESLTLPLLALDYNKCKCSEDNITIGVSEIATVSELDVIIEV